MSRQKEIKALRKKIGEERKLLLNDYDIATSKNPRSTIALDKLEEELKIMEYEDNPPDYQHFTSFLKKGKKES